MDSFTTPEWMTRKPLGNWGKATAAPRMTATQVAECAADSDFEIPEDVFDDRSQDEDDELAEAENEDSEETEGEETE